MKKFLLIVLLLLLPPVDDVINIEDIFPSDGVTCVEVIVRSAPRDDAPATTILSTGTPVRIRDYGRGYGANWVMIKPAEWIPIKALCKR